MKAPPCNFNDIVGKIKILTMEVRTILSTEELAERLKESFDRGGLGLELKEQGPDCLTFTGGRGYVTATFGMEGGKTLLRIVTSEWAVQVKKFVTELP